MFTASATSMNIPRELQGTYFSFASHLSNFCFPIHADLLVSLSGIVHVLIYFMIYLSVLLPKPSDKAVRFKFLDTQQLRNTVKMLHIKWTVNKNFLVNIQNFVHLAEEARNTGRQQNGNVDIKSN